MSHPVFCAGGKYGLAIETSFLSEERGFYLKEVSRICVFHLHWINFLFITVPYRKGITMKKVIVSISFLFFIPFCQFLNAEVKNIQQEQKISILENKAKMNAESIDAIRRDQLNYKIEKDLLKEAYSSNLQTINLVIALILGSLTIVGYIGVRSIDSIKKDFKGELEKLSVLRGQFEQRMKEFDDQFVLAKKRFDELSKINEVQDIRLQILEIQEKAAQTMSQRNYVRALEYIDIGLRLSSNDPILLSMKADALSQLGRLPDAAIVYEEALVHDPNNMSYIANLIELYSLLRRTEPAQSLLQKNSALILDNSGPYFSWYISALNHFMSGNEEKLKEVLTHQPVENPESQAKRIGKWGYKEVLNVINSMPTQPGQRAILSAIAFLEGNISLEDFNNQIA
jgi:tetratricopeptide (TPR) repeat protein